MVDSVAGGTGSDRSIYFLNEVIRSIDRTAKTFPDPNLGDPECTFDLLRLWITIEDEVDRRKIIGFIRTVATINPNQRRL